MRAILKLEMIGDDYFYYKKHAKEQNEMMEHRAKIFGPDKKPSWIAKLTGLDDRYGYKRKFLRGTRDYSQANSTGSRGIFMYYILMPGIYEVHARITWRRVEHYFCRVIGTQIIKISREEVEHCLTNGILE